MGCLYQDSLKDEFISFSIVMESDSREGAGVLIQCKITINHTINAIIKTRFCNFAPEFGLILRKDAVFPFDSQTPGSTKMTIQAYAGNIIRSFQHFL